MQLFLTILVEIQQGFFFFNSTMIRWCLKFIWRETGELNITWASLHVKEHEKIGLQTAVRLWVLSEQFSSVFQLCPTLCNPMDCSMPSFFAHHQLLELDQTHIHRVGDAIQPSHPLFSPSPDFNFC